MASERGKQSGSPPPEEETGAGGPRAGIPELMRKALAAGFSGFFMTEEAVRRALGDTLPKEWSEFAVGQSRRAQADFMDRLSVEIGRALQNMDLAAVLSQLLEGRAVEVKAEIRLRPDPAGEAPPPEVKVPTDEEAG